MAFYIYNIQYLLYYNITLFVNIKGHDWHYLQLSKCLFTDLRCFPWNFVTYFQNTSGKLHLYLKKLRWFLLCFFRTDLATLLIMSSGKICVKSFSIKDFEKFFPLITIISNLILSSATKNQVDYKKWRFFNPHHFLGFQICWWGTNDMTSRQKVC